MALASIDIPASMTRVVSFRYPDWSSAQETTPLDYNLYTLAKFAVPDEILYKRISYVDVRVWLYFNPRYPSDNSYNSVRLRLYGLGKTFSSNVTYNTKPYVEYDTRKENVTHYTSAFSGYRIFGDTFSNFRSVLDYGVEITADARYPDDGYISTSPTTNPITARVDYYDDEEPNPGISVSPSSGSYVPKGKANTLRWSLVNPSSILGKYSIVSSRLYWRNASDADYTVIDCGAATSYTMPAGTFTDDTIYWGVEITTQNGKNIRYADRRLSTQEPLGVATPESPINTVEDGSAPIRLTWSYANSSGMDPTASDLQVSSDGATWTDLPQVAGSAIEYTAPADSLPGGTVYWRVRAYNQDGAAGDWSAAVSFVNVAAPAAPMVSSDGAPYTTITWQAVGQQAYELTVDGRSRGITFGQGKSVTLPEPLADGEHTVAVRIQGSFGLWSQPGAVTFAVANDPARTLSLSGAFATDAELAWTEQEIAYTASDASVWSQGGIQPATGTSNNLSTRLRTDYLPETVEAVKCGAGYSFAVYAYTSANRYLGRWNGTGFDKATVPWWTELNLADLAAAGAAKYRVLLKPDTDRTMDPEDGTACQFGQLTPAQPIEGAVYQIYRDGVRIGTSNAQNYVDRMSLGSHSYYVLALELTENSDDTQTYSRSRTHSLRHFAGAAYPVLELSPYEDLTVSLDAAFLEQRECDAFEALLGQIVVYKGREDQVVVGALMQLERVVGDFYTVYSCQIQRVHWEEATHGTDT